MPRSSNIPQETIDRVLAAYQRGDTTRIIAEAHGISAVSVVKLARKAGISRRPGRQKAKAWGDEYVTAAGLANVEKRSPHRPKPAPPKVFVSSGQASVAEVKRLHHERGLGRTAIAALLRCSYREIDEALAVK